MTTVRLNAVLAGGANSLLKLKYLQDVARHRLGHPVLVVGADDDVRRGARGRLGVAHRDAHARELEHLDVVLGVAEREARGRRHAQPREQLV